MRWAPMPDVFRWRWPLGPGEVGVEPGGWEGVGVEAKSGAGGATVAGVWGGYSVPDAVAREIVAYRTQTGDLADDHQR